MWRRRSSRVFPCEDRCSSVHHAMLLERDADIGGVASKAILSITFVLLLSGHFPRDERPKLNIPPVVSGAMSLSHDSLLSRDVYSGSDGVLRGVWIVASTKQLPPRLASSSFSSSVQSGARPTDTPVNGTSQLRRTRAGSRTGDLGGASWD